VGGKQSEKELSRKVELDLRKENGMESANAESLEEDEE